LFLCDATPSDPLFSYCLPDSPAWRQESASVDADVILVSHTHLPFVKRLGTRTVVNPGSLGQPKDGGPEASYAVWQDGAVTLRKVTYPVDRTVAKLKELPLPAGIAVALKHLLRTGHLRRPEMFDNGALTAQFASRDNLRGTAVESARNRRVA
jgi:protein phosphatase